jgi:replication fork protection complex subunit Tof1/Swi1
MTASRHSRFGTTISVTLNTNKTKRKGDSEPAAPAPQPIVLHRQQAIGHDYESVIDIAKKQRSKKGNKLDDLATEDNLSIEARVVLKELAKEFLESSFNCESHSRFSRRIITRRYVSVFILRIERHQIRKT